MNDHVLKLVESALKSNGVEELFKAENKKPIIDIFDDEYISKINKIKLPNTKIKLLQKLLSSQINNFKKINKIKAIEFSKKFTLLVDKYNQREEDNLLVNNVLDDFTNEVLNLLKDLKAEKNLLKILVYHLKKSLFMTF